MPVMIRASCCRMTSGLALSKKKLRTTSLVELQEAFNILKGDMSVIGISVILGTDKENQGFPVVCGY